MKAVKTKKKAPKKAERIISKKDVIGEAFIALYHDDVSLCEENLFTLFELKKEAGTFVKLDLHNGKLYLQREGKYEGMEYADYPAFWKQGGKGAGKYKHLSEKTWSTLADRDRARALYESHHPLPVLREYPLDVAPPDFEAYYIKLIQGAREQCVYLRCVGEEWRVFYADLVEYSGFEAYACSEHVLKEVLQGTERRSAKGQMDCCDRIVGPDEMQYIGAFMPHEHALKRPKGLVMAADEEETCLVNAYYWKNYKSVACADEDYILPLFTALKEVAVHSVELEYPEEQEELETSEEFEESEELEQTQAAEEVPAIEEDAQGEPVAEGSAEEEPGEESTPVPSEVTAEAEEVLPEQPDASVVEAEAIEETGDNAVLEEVPATEKQSKKPRFSLFGRKNEKKQAAKTQDTTAPAASVLSAEQPQEVPEAAASFPLQEDSIEEESGTFEFEIISLPLSELQEQEQRTAETRPEHVLPEQAASDAGAVTFAEAFIEFHTDTQAQTEDVDKTQTIVQIEETPEAEEAEQTQETVQFEETVIDEPVVVEKTPEMEQTDAPTVVSPPAAPKKKKRSFTALANKILGLDEADEAQNTAEETAAEVTETAEEATVPETEEVLEAEAVAEEAIQDEATEAEESVETKESAQIEETAKAEEPTEAEESAEHDKAEEVEGSAGAEASAETEESVIMEATVSEDAPKAEEPAVTERIPERAETPAPVAAAPGKASRARAEAFFGLPELIASYTVAGRKKTKIKSAIVQKMPAAPLIVPITAPHYSDSAMVFVSKQAASLCGEKIVPFAMMSDKKALLPGEENEALRREVMVKTVVHLGKAYIPVFSDFGSAKQAYGVKEKFGVFTCKNLLTHIARSEMIEGITLHPGTVNLKLTESDFEKK